MPRMPRTTTAPVLPSRSLVASSTTFRGKAPRIYQANRDWQRECYRHYSICGEARFAAQFFGHAVSRANLFAAEREPDGSKKPLTNGPAFDAVTALFAGKDGQTEMLQSMGVHLTIAGECYLVGRQVAGNDIWEIVSVIEMRVVGEKWAIDYANGTTPIDLTDDDVVIRIWNPDPENKMLADSPFRSLLPILSEIEYLTRHVFAQISSRLAGAGILFLSQDMTFPAPPEQEGVEQVEMNAADAFMAVLADAMMTGIKDPSSPAAMIPIVVQVPDEVVDKSNLLHFWSDLDENARSMRDEAIRRFALGMDLPPEQILGMSSNSGTGGGRSTGVSHWGAWQIEEATIKLHVEPMLDVIVNSLTMGYLRPQMSDGEATNVLVWYETSALRLRPDRSKEAMELYDRGLITAEALLRETGFSSDDAISPEEFKRWLLVKIASGSATPEQVAAAVAALGVHLDVVQSASPETNPAPPAPSLMDHPSRPRVPDAAAVLAGSEGLVLRALERAGNRLRQAGQRPPGVPSYETHCHVQANGSTGTILTDAWATAGIVLDGVADPEVVVPVLNDYCRNLIAEQTPHTRQRLSEWLSMAGVL